MAAKVMLNELREEDVFHNICPVKDKTSARILVVRSLFYGWYNLDRTCGHNRSCYFSLCSFQHDMLFDENKKVFIFNRPSPV